MNKENKPNNETIVTKSEAKTRLCCSCNLPKVGDFQQIVHLRNSGLTIFIHKNEVQKTTRKKSEETFILHNVGERALKRPDYIREMCQYKTNCPKCKMLVKKVRSLIDETDHIKMDEVIGVCECCKRSNAVKCRRCENIVSKYLSLQSKDHQNKQARFVAWLIKLNSLLRDILDTDIICKHKLYQESQSELELEHLFSEFKSPLRQHKPKIIYFPIKEADQLPYLSALEESKEMLDKILRRIKSVKTPYEDVSFLSSSRCSGCVCKYFTSKNMEGRRSMEVLPQETYYPPGLINSREFVKSFRSSLKGSLDRERHGGRRSSFTDHSKERERSSIISGGSQDFDDSKDEYGKKTGSKSDDYGKEKGSKIDEYGRKGKVDEDMRREGREKNKEGKTKQESSIENLPKKRREITKKDKEGKITKKEVDTKEGQESKGKTDKEEDITKKGTKVNKATLKEDDLSKAKQGKDKKDKEEDITKKGTKVKKDTLNEDDLTKAKKGKDKKDKEEDITKKSTKVEKATLKEDDLTKAKKGKDKTDKEEDITKKGTKVEKPTLKDDLTKAKKGKDKTDKEEDITKKGTKVEKPTLKDDLTKAKKGKGKTNNEEDITKKGTQVEKATFKEDDLTKAKKGNDKKDKEEDITKKSTKVEKATLKEDNLTKAKKGKDKTDKENDITKKGTKVEKPTLKDDLTKAKNGKDKADKEEDITKKGINVEKATLKEGDLTKAKIGKGKTNKEEDITKKGTLVEKATLKEDNLTKAKKGKDKTDKEEDITKKGTKFEKTTLKDDLTKAKKGKNKTDKEEDITKKGTKVEKATLKEYDLTKAKKGKGKTDEELKEIEEKSKKSREDSVTTTGDKNIEETKSRKQMRKRTLETDIVKLSSEDQLLLRLIKELQMNRGDNINTTDQLVKLPEKTREFLRIPSLPTIKRTVKPAVPSPSDSENFECKDYQVCEVKEAIIGNAIRHFEPTITKKVDKVKSHELLLFKIMQSFPMTSPKIEEPQINPQTAPVESTRGVLYYQLSNRECIEKGWTVLPTTNILRKMNIYKMEMVNPEFDFFKRNKSKKILFYDTGEKLAEIYSDETGKWFYRNGNLALDCYNPEEPNIKKRYVIYSSGDEKENGIFIPITILGLFDQLGNAVIYDFFGNVRLKYNQTEGIIIDEKVGPQGRWKWHALNDPPVLKQVFVDTYLQERHEDLDDLIKSKEIYNPVPVKSSNTDMVMIEYENFVKEKEHKLLQKFKPFQIKMKAVKINDYFSIKIHDQACVTITFKSTPSNLRLNLGMHLINTEIVDSEISDVSEVATPYDRLRPAKTESVANIQEALNRARKYGKNIRNREQCGSSVTRSRGLTTQTNVSTSGSI